MHEILALATALTLGLSVADAADAPRFGQPITPADLAPWDISIAPDGIGLPPGSGTSTQGAKVYAEHGCALCHGDKGDGDFSGDSDSCKDGDQDQVDSNNRGDGQDFHSTQINSIALDSLTHTVTVTGIGTSGGYPVTFVMVEVESTLLTPGSVSFVFSDGFTNAGNLLDGSVALH